MLEALHIENLALIESLTIRFDSGFTVLTGETGAGKSIILGALSLLFGDKVDSSIIRTGENEAKVSAVIAVPADSLVIQYLEHRGVALDDESLILTRVVRSGSRGIVTVQGQPMTLSDLSYISHQLFDIHGQSEHQSLLHSDKQRMILDSFAQSSPLITTYQTLYHQYHSVLEEIEEMVRTIENARREQDYLSFVADELDRAKLQEGEDDELTEKVRILSQYEELHDNLELLYMHLKGKGDTLGAVGSTQNALWAARKISNIDSSAEEMVQRLESVLLELEDINLNARDKLSSMTFSQSELDSLQDRLALLQRLKKKYGPSLEDVIRMRDETQKKLSYSLESDSMLEQLEKKRKDIFDQLEKSAQRLSAHRKEWASILEEQIAQKLLKLQMQHVSFTICVMPGEEGPRGADSVEFMFSANLGEQAKPLKDIASGGELSRVMLAVKRVLGEKDNIDTLIFDEVDTGIGGAVAAAVGDQIAQLGANHQVLAITHLATIAAKADHQLVVQKQSRQGRTVTDIYPVSGHDRVEEIARMLSGHPDDESAVRHAQRLLEG